MVDQPVARKDGLQLGDGGELFLALFIVQLAIVTNLLPGGGGLDVRVVGAFDVEPYEHLLKGGIGLLDLFLSLDCVRGGFSPLADRLERRLVDECSIGGIRKGAGHRLPIAGIFERLQCAESLLFAGGLRLIDAAGSPRDRGATYSALYLVGYLAMAALALVLGAGATAWGLGVAIDLGAAAITIVGLVTLVLAATTRPDAPTMERTR